MARLIRQMRSTPTTRAVINSFPLTFFLDSAAASTAGNTLTKVCRADSSSVSSKSMACIMALLAICGKRRRHLNAGQKHGSTLIALPGGEQVDNLRASRRPAARKTSHQGCRQSVFCSS